VISVDTKKKELIGNYAAAAKELDGIAFLDGGYIAPNGRIRGMHIFSLGVRS